MRGNYELPTSLDCGGTALKVGHAVLAVIPSVSAWAVCRGRGFLVLAFDIGLPFWSSRHSTVFCPSKKAGLAFGLENRDENRSTHTKLLWLELLLLSILAGSKCDGSLSQSPTPAPNRQRATRSGPVSTSMHGVYRFEPRGSPSLGWEGSIFYFGYHIFQSALVNKVTSYVPLTVARVWGAYSSCFILFLAARRTKTRRRSGSSRRVTGCGSRRSTSSGGGGGGGSRPRRSSRTATAPTATRTARTTSAPRTATAAAAAAAAAPRTTPLPPYTTRLAQ